jgi:hypothetical protein
LQLKNFFDELQIDTKKISKVIFQEDYSKNEYLIKKYSRIATLIDENQIKVQVMIPKNDNKENDN